ncbi:MAG TPA: hypothetical protein VIT41_09540 [Microlunatus sp.]
MRASALIAVAAVVSLSVAGCTAPPPVPTETPHPGPPARTHWELRHRVVDTEGMRVVGQQLDASGEGTTVRLTDAATAVSEDCYVALSVPGEGGPENRVGEQTSTTYDGHPAVRSGAGAEADYLMWRLEDDSWVEVSCGRFDSWTSIERVAAAVDLEPTPIMIPFDVELPDGYGVAAISNDLDRPSGRVHLGRVGRQPWSPAAELDVAYGATELSADPPGEPTTLAGRVARVDDTSTSPAVWVQEQGRWLYVGVTPSDTGPYPNRREELPAMQAIAESLSPAGDLDEVTTWLAADGVFG